MQQYEKMYERSTESLHDIPAEDFISLLEPKTEQAITFDGIATRLKENQKLNIKFGTDPTGPDLHLGHMVPMRVVDLFSRAGHHIDLIFGDFTAKVGDPTEREHGRPLLDDEAIADNMKTFRIQVDKYFDTRSENVSIHTNSTWLGKMTLDKVFGFLQSINLTEATQRKDFRERMQHGQAVSLAETIYGTLMGIDSVELETDIEIGGIDQLLNFQQTRTVQRSQGQKAEEIIMTPIIEGTSGDGRKMSKSYGNYVPVMASSEEIFGKIMSIPDTLIVPYLKAFAPIYKNEVNQLKEEALNNPLELKKQLGSYMVSIAASSTAEGLEARENFERRFSSRVITAEDAKPLNIANNLLNTLMQSGDFNSFAEIRRLAQQGGIKINGTKISPEELMESHMGGSIVTVGKRKIYSLMEND